ncbi:MAG: LytTR family transcriptional regulator [Chitinophagaceae bacterium]|nr:LytTR family transcriptional regulator [Chitinophagaceae bacterium]
MTITHSSPVLPAALMLHTSKGIEHIYVHEIVRIEAISNYSKLYFANGKTLVVAKVLRWFEENQATAILLRPHRTHLVNRSYIQQYSKKKGGQIYLRNGECIEVSRRKRTAFLSSWQAAA